MSCVVGYDPGGRPIVGTGVSDDGGSIVTWANPSEMHCGSCDWRVGPAIPGAGTPTTTVPYEVISGRNGIAGVATGFSVLDSLGAATELIRNAAARRGLFLGQRIKTLRPDCTSCNGMCICGRRVFVTPLPDDVCEILEVLIAGVPLRSSPPGTIASVSDPSRLSFVGSQLTISSGPAFLGSYTWLDDEGVTHTSPIAYKQGTGPAFASPRAIIAVDNAAVVVNLPSRRAWRKINVHGTPHLERLNPNGQCDPTCPCGTSSQTMWPLCQRDDLPDTEDCTWSIKLLRGNPVPLIGRMAVAALACTLTPALAGLPCQLPQPLVALQNAGGFDFADLVAATAKSATVFGVREVDMFLSTYKMPRSYAFGAVPNHIYGSGNTSQQDYVPR